MFLIPTNELTLSDIRAYRAQAKAALIERAKLKGIVTQDSELVIRDGIPGIDITVVPATQFWLTGALVAATLYTYVNAALAVNRLAAFYKVCVEQAAPASTAQIYFQRGPTGATTIGVIEVEPLYTKMETEGYLSEPVIYDNAETMFIRIFPRLASAGERVSFGVFVAEPVGNLVS